MSNHVIPITNGIGSKELVDGEFNATAEFEGYDNASISPETVTIDADTTEYSFTIAATGTLTIHVSDDGTTTGVPIEGAIFYRCDAEGNTYGNAITTDVDGNAVFNNVPFSANGNAPTIYFKQDASDGEHTFTTDLQNTKLEEETATIEIANAEATQRTFKITDVNYENLPITDGKLNNTKRCATNSI